jgi:biotin carboxyl carrier protein
MKHYQITVNSHTFDVRLLSDPRLSQVEVEVNGEAFTVAVETIAAEGEKMTEAVPSLISDPALNTAPPQSLETATPPSGRTVTAPLPGVIKRIAVRPGQQVATGEELLVIEAMKMDNVIRASREGTIETIYTAEGRQVAHGERLLEYQA